MSPTETEILHELKDWLPLIAAAVAIFVALKLRPVEKAIEAEILARAEQDKKLGTEIEHLEEKIDEHLRESVESYHNFDRWRGSVTTLLEQNTADHNELKAGLKYLAEKAAALAEEILRTTRNHRRST